MDRPEFFLIVIFLGNGEFCYKVCQGLGFYGCLGAIFYIELTKLNGPLNHPSSSLRFVHGFLDRLIRHYFNQVGLKVWMKFSRGHYQGKGNLLYQWVSGFCPLKGLANIIY